MSTYAEREVHMTTNQNNIGKVFWLAWVSVSLVGFSVGAFLGQSAWGLFPGHDGFDATIGITFGVVMGAAGGCLQCVVLREKVARAGWWVLASALGFAITFGALGAIGIINENSVMAGILFAPVFGVAGGILQWLVLRHAGIARAGMWVPANILGSLVAAIAFPAGFAMNAVNYNVGALVLGLLFGAGLGAIPGAVLVWLLRQSPSSNVEDMATAH
jgi:hypothetical protein